MDIIEVLIFLVWVLLVYFFIKKISITIQDVKLRIALKQLYVVKVISCFLFTCYILYFSSGDSHDLYYFSGNNITNLLFTKIENISLFFNSAEELDPATYAAIGSGGYIENPSNFTVIKLAGFLGIFTFGKYLLLNFLFAMISFAGIWKLYLFFYKKFPQYYFYISIALIYLPSFQFWSSGTGKEAVCIASVGWITYYFHNLVTEKKLALFNLFFLAIAAFFLIKIKIYIFLSYVPVFFLFGISGELVKSNNKFIQPLIKIIVFVGGLIGIFYLVSSNKQALGEFAIQDIVENTQSKNELYQRIAETTESSFNLGTELDGSVWGLIKATPYSIVATLFRPFIWEAKKLSSLISAIESLYLIFITLRPIAKFGIIKFVKTIITEKIITYSFIFSITFAVFVGMTTLNFGSLIRYKIPCLPFYTISMLLIYQVLSYNKTKLQLK